MKARAPGKLILSGEHSVVHGRPALALAVNRHAQTVITPNDDAEILVHFPELCGDVSIPVTEMDGLRRRVEDNYKRFLDGELPVERVIERPAELICYASCLAHDSMDEPLSSGYRLDLSTDLPVGCGMGSSAAVIVSVLGAVTSLAGTEMTSDELFRCAWDVEKIQHGRPSGVDPYISVHGGMVRFQGGRAVPVKIPGISLCLVHTGVPECTTGESVMEVGRRFEGDPVWDEFERVTMNIEKAMALNDIARLRDGVRENHRLLCRIGVVPDRVEKFILELEKDGASAKICGAGAVTGDAGGMVWVLGDNLPERLCGEYGYELMGVEPEPEGCRIIQ